jgi:hypothetical protein
MHGVQRNDKLHAYAQPLLVIYYFTPTLFSIY